MKTTLKEPIKIGIIIGAGTGWRLAEIFREFLSKIVRKHDAEVSFVEGLGLDNKPFHSYQSLEKEAGKDSELFKKISWDEVAHLEDTMIQWYSQNVRAIFRTAINAETLYIFRQRVKAVKEFSLNTLHGRRILFVRDQAEGFYANTAYSVNEGAGEIHFEGKFTKEHQQQVVRYAIRRAEEKFKGQTFRKWAIYKHHLFGDALQDWVREVDKDIEVYQPDTGLTNLHGFFDPPEGKFEPGNLLVVCSNEVGDIIYESLIKDLDGSAKLMLHSKNVYMVPPFQGQFFDYQTVHGSADDKVVEDKKEEEILPYAALRIAAEIAEDILGLQGVRKQMEKAIITARRNLSNKTSAIKQTIFSHFQIESDD